jgi:hypothetical protein
LKRFQTNPKLDWETGTQLILDISSKQIYEIFLGKKQIPPTAKRKLPDKYPDINVERDTVYSLPIRTTLESKTESDIIFGKFDIKNKNNFTFKNHILLFGKYYIYSTKCQNSLPTVQGFISRIKIINRIELQIWYSVV